MPSGAGADTECDGSMVEHGFTCKYTKAGASCEAAVCASGVWSTVTPVCEMNECPFDQLTVPGATSPSGEGCTAGGSVLSGGQCQFHSDEGNAATCGPALCREGGWVNTEPFCESPEAAQSAATCDFSVLQLPGDSSVTGMYADGRESDTAPLCSAEHPVEGGVTCVITKVGHSCASATCSGGQWSDEKPTCSENGCPYSSLVIPDGASTSGVGCSDNGDAGGGTVPSQGTCHVSKSGHGCESVRCLEGSWTSTTPLCTPDGEPAL